jgi:hypothetical protein
MKKILFLVFILFTIKLSAQKDIVTDSLVRNSPPYSMWFVEYVKLKKDSNFQIELTKNEDLKKQYEITEKYFKLYNKRFGHAMLNLLTGEGLILASLLNIKLTPYFLVPSYLILIYEFSQMNNNYLLANKFFYNEKLLVEKSGVQFNKEKWKVTQYDRYRYEVFNRKYNRIKARMLRKHKHLDLVNVDQY